MRIPNAYWVINPNKFPVRKGKPVRKFAFFITLLIMMTLTLPTFAQNGDGERTLITPENAADLVVLAELPTLDNNDLSWSPDSRFLASEIEVEEQVKVIIWDSETWEEYRIFDGHIRRIWHLLWSPDSQYLASISPDDNAIRIWDVENDSLYREFEHQFVSQAAWSPDGTMISSTGFDEKLRVWDIESGEVVFEASASGGETTACTVWSSDQTWLASNIFEDGEVVLRVWDVATWELYTDFTLARLGNCPTWSSDSRELATIARDILMIYDVEAQSAVRSIEQLNTEFIEFEWSADDSIIATGAQGGRVMLWDMTTGDVLIPFQAIPEPVDGVHAWEIKLSPDANLLAAPTEETVEIWNAQTGILVASLRGHSPDVVRLEWSPDGTLLASTDRTGQVFVWGIADE